MSAESKGRSIGALWAKAKWHAIPVLLAVAIFFVACYAIITAEEKDPSTSATSTSLVTTESRSNVASGITASDKKMLTKTNNNAVETSKAARVDAFLGQKDKSTATKWTYSADIDPMSGKEARYASVDADSDLNFSFPYQKPNRPSLFIRAHPKYGTDVILRVEKGQFICRYDRCSVMVRFDDKPAVRFTATQPSDNSSTSLFLSPSKKMIAGLKTSTVVRVQATFYQEGDQIMTFKTAGLSWK
jgi:hypothetical protein